METNFKEQIEALRRKGLNEKFVPTQSQIDEKVLAMFERGYTDQVDAESFHRLAVFLACRAAGKTRTGVLLTGPAGTGKTMWLSLFAGCRMISASEVYRMTQKHGIESAVEIILPPREYDVYPAGYFNLAIDDIGTENSFNHFGVKMEPMQAIIETAYNRWQRGMAIYYASTNLGSDMILKRYGERVFSRMCQMFTIIKINGHDQRLNHF